jgi:hypothetical protein
VSSSLPILLWIGAGLVTVGIALIWRDFLSKPAGPRAALDQVAIDALHDVLLPDGMDGQIYLEHLVLTSRGIIVVDLWDVPGTVFASDRMEQWTVILNGRRSAFPNPQGTLFDRIAAVRQIVPSIPIHGHLLFGTAADFSKGRPKHVVLSDELEQRYRRPSKDECERILVAYAPHWDKLRAATQGAESGKIN